MTHILHRQIGRSYPTATTARGVMIRDSTGKEYIDASGGAAVSCLGHSHPDVLSAMHQQLDQLAYAHTSFFTSQAAEELADELVAHAPEGLSRVFYVSGGSEAVEAALKLARQYFVERGQLQRRFIIARRQSYHGVTLGALAIGGREWQRKPFGPLLIETHHVSPVYEYRGKRSDETAEAYGARLAEELESKIDELSGKNVIAFVAETVVGATLGAVPAVSGYFRRVREICDRHGILLILDEGIEIVFDRGTKEPFDPSYKLHARIKHEAMTRGLMVYPMGGTVDGMRGDHVLLAPPFIIDSGAIDAVVERLGDAIDAAVAT